MQCKYCSTYQCSSIRTNGTRFCVIALKMMEGKDKICDRFSLADIFYCAKNECQLSVPICLARQDKDDPTCSRCRQKSIIWDIKRFIGRRVKREKPTIIRRQSA